MLDDVDNRYCFPPPPPPEPTPEEMAEIAERTRAVRDGWTPEEEERRRFFTNCGDGGGRVEWRLPVYVVEYVPAQPLSNARNKQVKVYKRIE